MREDGKLPNLTKTYNKKGEHSGYALHVTATKKAAPALSEAVTDGMVATDSNKSAFVVAAVTGYSGETVARERNECALDILDDFGSGYGMPEGVRRLVTDLRMALLGCPVKNETVFTGELSQEYIERYGDNAS